MVVVKFCAWFALLASCSAPGAAPSSAPSDGLPDATGGSIEVPIDRTDPQLGRARLEYECGAPFDRAKPTVLVVADGQQFFLQKGALGRLQKEIAGGDALNVVGLFGRGATQAFLEASLGADRQPDWPRAWRIFRAEEWLDDLDDLRVALGGRDSSVMLYGASGGALLVHQFLARHGEHVTRAYTSAAVQPFIVGDLGLSTDHFWEEIGQHDRESQALLSAALAAHPDQRLTIAMLLQRQNFFVEPDQLAARRAALIRDLAAWDTTKLAEARETYQVDAIRAMFDSHASIPIRVREFEFSCPANESPRLGRPEFRPDLEVHAAFAKPLFDALAAHSIDAPTFDFAALHRLRAEVLVVAGRLDHTVDYRTSIALAAHYPNGRVLVLDDDHVFKNSNTAGELDRVLQAFMLHGSKSAEFEAALAAIGPHRWRE